jgi:hypothetical protein
LFGFFPFPIEFGWAELGSFPALFGQLGLDVAYAGGKSSSGVTASGLRIDSAVPGEVDQGEKEVSELPCKGGTAAFGFSQLLKLFPDLGWDASGGVRPVKAHPGCPFLKVLGEKKGREMKGNPVEGAFAGGFLLLLELVPSLENLGGVSDSLFAKHMGVSANQFFRQFSGNGL